MLFPPLMDHYALVLKCRNHLDKQNNAPIYDEDTLLKIHIKHNLTSIVPLAQKLQKPEQIFSKLIIL